MSTPKYLIDTNIVFALEDDHPVQPIFAELHSLAGQYSVGILVHEAARDDVIRDQDVERRQVSLSKLANFPILEKVRSLTRNDLEKQYGSLPKPNDEVDATLLHALEIGAADFLVSQDQALHSRARRRSQELAGRVLYVAGAVDLLRTTFEPRSRSVRHIEEVAAHTISEGERIFDSLREDYPEFEHWWRKKCVPQHRRCWVVYDNGLAGLVVRKDESSNNTDATLPAQKILKICTFKLREESRGVKLGELLLKNALWFGQINKYDLLYLTVYERHMELIDLIEYYGFKFTTTLRNSERIYEKPLANVRLNYPMDRDVFKADRLHYPRFVAGPNVKAFCVPIREAYHDVLYPDLKERHRPDLFEAAGLSLDPIRPGNTIRKVYLSRGKCRLGQPGSMLFFYKTKSRYSLSQALTAIGIFEEDKLARSTIELARLAGGRSVYSQTQLSEWNASPERPVRVINFLHVGYIEPAMPLAELRRVGVFGTHPVQSISRVKDERLDTLLARLDLGFDTTRI